LHVIGNLLHDPQAMAVLARQRIQVSFQPVRCQRVTVVNLAMQGTGQVPYPQPSRSAAMADGVRC
jgi:hypothetical protein